MRWRAAAVYSVAAVIVTFPLAFSLSSRLGALQGPGDPYLNLWILGWGMHAWITDPTSVLTGRVFDANIFFPAEGTLAYSDHFLLQALALSPVYAATGNAVLCYNLLLLLSIAASGLAMHALVRAVTGSEAGAFVAGLAWACWPYRTAHLLHIQLQALYLLPLVLLCLHRVVARRRWRDTLLLAVLMALQVAASVYYGVMAALVLVVGATTLGVATGQWRSLRLWSRLAVAALLAFALSVPLMLPYIRSQQSEGFGRTLFEARTHAASLQAYTQVPPVNLVYGATGLLDPRAPQPGERDRRHVEHQIFPGIAIVALAVLGFAWHGRSDARPLAASAAALVLAGVVLSLGPDGITPLYAALHENAFGFQAIRAPGRFAVIAMLGLALLAALGTRSLLARIDARAVEPIASASPRLEPEARGRTVPKARTLATAAIIGALSFEYVNVPLPLAAAPPLRTEVGQWLAHEPAPGAVLHWPLPADIENTPVMVQSLEHWRPIVNGYSGQRPAFFTSLADSVADLPSPTAFAALHGIDVRFLVAERPIAGAASPRSPLVERARLGDGIIYELVWTPEALAALDDGDAPPPPPPGRAPFAAGEVLTYDVYWDSGPVDVPAGSATLSVIEGSTESGRWHFALEAVTADWVSTFFEARDRFITFADASLLPLEHRREIREGRRQLDRRYVYDHAAGTVTTAQMTLPLADQARDALTALYYVRTLPLEREEMITLPMNEAGTPLVLHVAVGEVEPIEIAGASTRALRLEPRVMRAIERRRPMAMTIWFSVDGRSIPLRALVEAGFGTVRLEIRR